MPTANGIGEGPNGANTNSGSVIILIQVSAICRCGCT